MSAPEESKQQVEQLAALIGTTSAELKKLDENIVSTSTNLQHSKDAWNPEAVLMQGMQDIGTTALPGQQPVGPMPQSPIQRMPEPQPAMPQQIPMAQPMPVQAHITLPPNIEERLGRIEDALQQMTVQLEKFTELETKVGKFIQKGMDGRVKQITLKLDGSQNTQ